MSRILCTSGYNFEGYRITEYLGFCSGECVLGTGFLSSLSAGIADFLGSNSKLYEEKLLHAKEFSISELEKKAISVGANAIIGLNVDYTTFTSDIMGVVANGTAVKVIKSIEYEDKTFNENSFAEFPIINYYNSLPIRPFKISLDKEKKELEMSIFCYQETGLTALNVDIIANTIFGTTYEYCDINFVNCYINKGIVNTEKIRFDIPVNQMKAIESFTVKVNHFILCGEIVSLYKPYRITKFTVEKLREIRIKCGNDVVNDFQNTSDGWICVCGYNNKNNDDKCQFCGRTNGIYDKVKLNEISLNEYLPQLQELNNCKEMVDFLVDIEKKQGFIFPNLMMDELRELKDVERLYGNMQRGALNIIMKYISE